MMDRHEIDSVVQQKVDEIIEFRIRAYKKVVYSFFTGLGLLLIVLIGSGLVAQRSLIVTLHDMIFGFEGNLDRALSNSVAVSYNRKFILGSDKYDLLPFESVTFYADTTQSAIAYVDLKHVGPGEPSAVSILLDEYPEPLWQKSKDAPYIEMDLTTYIRRYSHVMERPGRIHYLTISLENSETIEDIVYVNILINVIGKERF